MEFSGRRTEVRVTWTAKETADWRTQHNKINILPMTSHVQSRPVHQLWQVLHSQRVTNDLYWSTGSTAASQCTDPLQITKKMFRDSKKKVSNRRSRTTVWELLVNTATLVSGANNSGNNAWLTNNTVRDEEHGTVVMRWVIPRIKNNEHSMHKTQTQYNSL